MKWHVFRADARTRTGDPFITSEVLYQLSYVGEAVRSLAPVAGTEARRAAKAPVGRDDRATAGARC